VIILIGNLGDGDVVYLKLFLNQLRKGMTTAGICLVTVIYKRWACQQTTISLAFK